MNGAEERPREARDDAALPVRITILGRFGVERGGEAVPDSAWVRRSAGALVKLLATNRNHRLGREQIEDSLWPDLDPEAAYVAYRQAVHASRHLLEPELAPRAQSRYLRTHGDMLGLVPGLVHIDADAFESAAGAALRSDDEATYEAALQAYTGALLPEEPYAEWAVERREALAALRLQVLLGLAGALERRGLPGAAMERLRQALEQEPWLEAAHRELMRLYARNGRRHQALQQYQICRHVLGRELQVGPEPETTALYEAILAGSITPEVAPRSPDPAAVPLPTAVRRMPGTPMIGRERALEVLRDDLRRAAGGNGGLVLVTGEPGVGKTRILAELVRTSRQTAVVLWGASYQQESLVPYGPFVEALDAYLAGRPAHERLEVGRRHAELVRLLPSLHTLGPLPRPTRSRQARTQLFASVVRFLSDLSEAHPVLLMLDDLHAADGASLELLHHLSRAARDRPLLLAAAYREEDVAPGSAFERFCLASAREGSARQITLLRLAREECDALVQSLHGGAIVSDELLDWLYDRSLGNPLFVQELLALVAEGGIDLLTTAEWDPSGSYGRVVPSGVRQMVDERMNRLDTATRAAAALAAAAGMRFSFELLRAAGIVDDAPLLDALDDLLRRQIVEERSPGYVFRHPLFRQAIYERLSQERRARLHAALGHGLERTEPSQVEALAHHFARSHDRERALRYLEAAGDEARANYANDVAATYYEEVLGRLDAGRQPADVGRIEGKLGSSLVSSARYDQAEPHLERAVDLHLRARDREGVVLAAAEIGRLHWERGTAVSGLQRIRGLFQDLDVPEVSPAAACRLYLAVAHLNFASGRYEEQRAAAERASTLAREAGDGWLLAEAEMRRGTAYLMMGSGEHARHVLDATLPIAEAAGHLDALGRCLSNLASTLSDSGDLRTAVIYRERSVDVAERMGNPAYLASGMSNLAGIYFLVGRWVEAQDLYHRSLIKLDSIGNSWYRPFVLTGLAGIAMHQGRLDEARQHAVESLKLAESMENAHATDATQRMLAEIELLEGQREIAYRRLREYIAGPGAGAPARAWLLPAFLEACLQIGYLHEAEELLTWLEARPQTQCQIQCEVARLTGVLRMHQDRPVEALAAFERSLQLAIAMPYVLCEAQTRHCLTKLYQKMGVMATAREHAEQAHRIVRDLGAFAVLRATERTLKAHPACDAASGEHLT